MIPAVQIANVWFFCAKCNNSRHRVLPGEKAPFWWCQDNKVNLKEGDEVEIEDIEEGGNNAEMSWR